MKKGNVKQVNKRTIAISIALLIAILAIAGFLYMYRENGKNKNTDFPEINIMQILNLENREVEEYDIVTKHAKDMEVLEYKDYIELLEGETQNFIKGSFSWNYKNEDNKNSFLSHRVGYFYHERGYDLSATELYDLIREDVIRYKLKIEPEFEFKKDNIYLHPEWGAYAVRGNLKLNVQTDSFKDRGLAGTYEVPYEYLMAVIVPLEDDVWELWDCGNLGQMSLMLNYIIVGD